MDNNDDDYLHEGKRSILRQLFDAIFGRTEATREEVGRKIHLLGTFRRRLDET